MIDASRTLALVAHALILFKLFQGTSCYRRWRANQGNLTLVLWLTQLVKQWLTFCLDERCCLSKNCETLALNSTSVRYQTILRKDLKPYQKLTFNNLHSDKLVDTLNNHNSMKRNYYHVRYVNYSPILMVVVIALAGLEGILDQFNSTNHLLHVPSSVLGIHCR